MIKWTGYTVVLVLCFNLIISYITSSMLSSTIVTILNTHMVLSRFLQEHDTEYGTSTALMNDGSF